MGVKGASQLLVRFLKISKTRWRFCRQRRVIMKYLVKFHLRFPLEPTKENPNEVELKDDGIALIERAIKTGRFNWNAVAFEVERDESGGVKR
jgi:hypothetical protein